MRHVTLAAMAPFVLFLSACGGAVPESEAVPEPAIAIEPNYSVIAEDSRITVSALQQGERFSGEFEAFEAAIRFDADDLSGSRVRVRIPLAGLDLGSSDRNDALPGKVWFNMGAHPVATFVSESIAAEGEGYVAQGELTMKGLRRPVSLPFTLDTDGPRMIMRGTLTLDRTNWNLGERPWDTEEWISHAVDVDIVVVAEKT